MNRRAELAFLGVRGLSAAGYFLIVPFLAIWLIDDRGISGAQAATVVAVCLFCGRTGAIVMSRVITRVGLHRSVLFAYVSAAATLVTMGAYSGDSVGVWVALGSVFGVAFSSATAALKALVVVAYAPEQQLWAFSRLNLAVNSGAPAGVAAGGWLVAHAPEAFIWGGAALYSVAVLLVSMIPSATHAAPAEPDRLSQQAGRVAPLILFLVITGLTWVAYAQVFTVLPTFAASTVGPQEISYLFVLNSVIVVVLQTPVTAAVRRFRKSRPLLAAATVLPVSQLALGAAVLAFGFTGQTSVVLAYSAMVLFSLTELVWAPAFDSEVPKVKGRFSDVTAYGIAGATRGGAESLGSWVGIAVATSAAVTWPTSAIAFWASAGGLILGAAYFAATGLGEHRRTSGPRSAVRLRHGGAAR
ncbi:MAG: MFS transporter [Dermatophilaceae bacterium]